MSLRELSPSYQNSLPLKVAIQSSIFIEDTEDEKSLEPESKRQQRSPTSDPSQVSWSDKPPAPGSLNALLRDHKRERLYVRPIAWTSVQLQLLGVTFANSAPVRRTNSDERGDTQRRPDDGEEGREKGRNVENASITEAPWRKQDWLQSVDSLRSLDLDLQRLSVILLLELAGLVYYCNDGPSDDRNLTLRLHQHTYRCNRLPFQFQGRTATRIRTEGLFARQGSPPCIAYVNLETVANLRKRHIFDSHRPTRGRSNVPMYEQHKKMLRSITPPDKREDPYLVGVMIALAQRWRASGGQSEETHTVHVVALPGHPRPGQGPRYIYFYTALVSADFLRRMEEPSEFIEAEELKVRGVAISLVDQQKAARLIWRILKKHVLG